MIGALAIVYLGIEVALSAIAMRGGWSPPIPRARVVR